MGGILGGAGSVVTGAGGGLGGFVGDIFGGVAGGAADAAGATSQYKADNPYAPEEFQKYLNERQQLVQNQNSLAQALQAQMAGQGPNPAQTQFMANQQANIANAQGLIASQRGLNPALAARMGVNAASNANQQAALGSALMQQQQQLNATNSLGGLYGQMQSGNLGSQQLYNQANLGQQNLNQQVAGSNANIRGQITGGLIQGVAGGMAKGASGGGAAHGALVGGKANVPGDSPQNDTVPAMLSPGEIVLPRSVAHDPEKAKEFVDHLLKSSGKKKGGYGSVLEARRKKAS
jgi:hypothetical protein